MDEDLCRERLARNVFCRVARTRGTSFVAGGDHRGRLINHVCSTERVPSPVRQFVNRYRVARPLNVKLLGDGIHAFQGVGPIRE